MNGTSEDVLAGLPGNKTIPWTFLKPLVSLATLNMYTYGEFFVVNIPALFVGFFTNTANIVVYCNMGFSESSNVNFLVLSVFDLFYTILQFLIRAFYLPVWKSLDHGPFLVYISHCFSLASTVVICGSAMMTALIATERCVCVVFPLKVMNAQHNTSIKLQNKVCNIVFTRKVMSV